MLSRSLLFLVGMTASAVSSAAIISFNYTGVSLDGDATVTGTFGYDDATIDGAPDNDDYGQYINAGFWTGAVTGGPQDGARFNFTNITYEVYNDDPIFGDTLSASVPDSSGDTSGSLTYFDLDSEAATVFTDDSLPAAIPLDEFDYFGFVLGTNVGGNTLVDYEFSNISPVPLPAAAWLFGSALIGFVSWSRKKQVA
jgi:hypothetical protein